MKPGARREVLVTRAPSDAARTAARLDALGYSAVIAPMTHIVATGVPAPERGFQALAVTSAHAAEALWLLPDRGVPVFAVGGRTEEAVRDCGFTSVAVAEGDAVSLARLIASALKPPAHVVHVTTRHHKPEPALSLRAAGFVVDRWEAYEAEAVKTLPEPAAEALRAGRIAAALQYSARSSAIFIECAREAQLLSRLADFPHLCLSEDVARPLRALGFSVRVATQPDETALLRLLPRAGLP